MTREKDIFYLMKAVEVSKKAKKKGNPPFGAILVDSQGDILIEQENVEITQSRCTGHAVTALMEEVSYEYDREFLWDCTLYTTVEPCIMCSGAIYWGNVGRVVYGIDEEKLYQYKDKNDINAIFDLHCREVFKRGQKDIIVEGPFNEVEEEVLKVHEGYWK